LGREDHEKKVRSVMAAKSGIADTTKSAEAAGPGEFEALSFRFPVTWSLLSPRVESPRVAIFPSVDLPRAEVSKPTGPRDQSTALVETERRTRRPGGSFEWEMVVPKMVRPAKKGSLGKAAAASTARLPPPPDRSATEDRPISARDAGTSRNRSVPNLYTTRAPEARWLALKIGLAVAGVLAVTVPVWRHASRESPQQVDTAVNGGDWLREAAVRGAPGVGRARQLLLYRPSIKATDSRLEFDWTMDEKGVGWVFRARDLGNYYAMRLKLLKPGGSPALGVEYFTVHDWVEGAHSEKVLILSGNPPVLRVRMDVFGPTFTMYMQGAPAVYWTDARLTSGATGFFEESHETPGIGSVRMSFAPHTGLRRGIGGPAWGELEAQNGLPAGGV
jgi:hypothetical protein